MGRDAARSSSSARYQRTGNTQKERRAEWVRDTVIHAHRKLAVATREADNDKNREQRVTFTSLQMLTPTQLTPKQKKRHSGTILREGCYLYLVEESSDLSHHTCRHGCFTSIPVVLSAIRIAQLIQCVLPVIHETDGIRYMADRLHRWQDLCVEHLTSGSHKISPCLPPSKCTVAASVRISKRVSRSSERCDTNTGDLQNL